MKPIQINPSHQSDFIDEFLAAYLQQGLGSMPKREVDILMVHLLEKYAGLSNYSNHDLSILLQTTEKQVKKLRYEARLKYPPEEGGYVRTRFLGVLAGSQYDIVTGRIALFLEDEYLRNGIQNLLKGTLSSLYVSLKGEILKVSPRSLAELIDLLYGREAAERFSDGLMDGEVLSEDPLHYRHVISQLVDFSLGSLAENERLTARHVLSSLLPGDSTTDAPPPDSKRRKGR